MAGAGLACTWPMVAVVAGAVSSGLACCVTAACCVDGWGAGFAASAAGLAGSAGFTASGLGFGTGTLRLATCGAEAGGRGPRAVVVGGSGPGGP